MSIAVQLSAEPKIQLDTNQPGSDGAQGESGEFSSVIEDVSEAKSSSESSNTADTNSESNDHQDSEAREIRGKEPPREGKDLPSENIVEEDSDETNEHAFSAVQAQNLKSTRQHSDIETRVYGELNSETLAEPAPQKLDESVLKGSVEHLKTTTQEVDALNANHEKGTQNLSPTAPSATARPQGVNEQPGMPLDDLEPLNLSTNAREVARGSTVDFNGIDKSKLGQFSALGGTATKLANQPDTTVQLTDADVDGEALDSEIIFSDQKLAGRDVSKRIDLENLVRDFAPGSQREFASGVPSNTQTSTSSLATNPASPTGNFQATQSLMNSAGLSTPNSQLLNLGAAVSDQAWGEEFAVRVRTLVSGNVQQATLNLRPAELGSIEVQLATDGNETKAQFTVQNAAVREVLENSLPKLREIFQESGLSLTDTDVRDQSQSQQSDNSNNTAGNEPGRDGQYGLASEESNDLDQQSATLNYWDNGELRSGVDTFI